MRDDYYELLGLSSTARASDITSAYKKLALQLHPDKSGGGDSESFAAVSEAYRVLSDAAARRRYDERARWIQTHPEQVRPLHEFAVGALPQVSVVRQLASRQRSAFPGRRRHSISASKHDVGRRETPLSQARGGIMTPSPGSGSVRKICTAPTSASSAWIMPRMPRMCSETNLMVHHEVLGDCHEISLPCLGLTSIRQRRSTLKGVGVGAQKR